MKIKIHFFSKKPVKVAKTQKNKAKSNNWVLLIIGFIRLRAYRFNYYSRF